MACLLPAIPMAVLALLPDAMPGLFRLMLGAGAASLILLSRCFAWLETRDDGDALRVRFGPLSLFSLRVPYADIRTAARCRSALIDGWGIHYIPGRGWTWNLWGRECVELELASGKRIRVGSDDPDGLLAAVIARTGLPG